MQIVTAQAWNDAGLLREFVATEFEGYLTAGGHILTAQRCHRHVLRLARLTGIDCLQLYADLRADAEAIEDSEEG